jgi:hypothetical protein
MFVDVLANWIWVTQPFGFVERWLLKIMPALVARVDAEDCGQSLTEAKV